MRNAAYIPPDAGAGLDYTPNDVVYIAKLTMYCLNNLSPDNHLLLGYVDILAQNGFDNQDYDNLIGLICAYLRFAGYDLEDGPGVEEAIKLVVTWLACEDAYEDVAYFESMTPQAQNVIIKGVNKYREMQPGIKRTIDTYERDYRNTQARHLPPAGRPDYHRTNAPLTPPPRRQNIGGYGRPDPRRAPPPPNRRGGGGLPMGTTRHVANNALNTNRGQSTSRVWSAADIRAGNGYATHSRAITRDSGASRELSYGGENSATDAGTVSRNPASNTGRPTRHSERAEQSLETRPVRNSERPVNLKDADPQSDIRRAHAEVQATKQAKMLSLTPIGNELSHKLPSGKEVLIVEATKANEQGRVNNYCKRTPVTPLDMRGYYILDEKKDISGFILLNNEDNNMEKSEHETARFFKPWGLKNGLPDPKETSRELAKLQTKAQVTSIERELIEKYGNAETGKVDIPADDKAMDFDRLHIINNNNMACVDANDDLVAIGKRLLLEGVANEDIKQLYREASQGGEIVPVNYHGIHFYNWSLSPESGGDKALELRGLTTHSSIRRKLFELSELVPSSTMHLIDKLATDWVNSTMNHRFGYEGEAIDSYMLNIEELLDFLHTEPGDVVKAFNSAATHLVNTVLYPHTTSEDYVRKALQLDEGDDEVNVVFASVMSITLINIDSDKFAVNAEDGTGSVTMVSWPSMHAAIETIRSSSKPQVSEYYIVTRDNCKMQVSLTVDSGVYSLARA